MKKIMKSTTTLGLCLSLALPAGAFAQTAEPRCGTVKDQAQYPCYLKDGTEVADKKELRAIRTARGEARQEAEAAGEQVTEEALQEAAQDALENSDEVLQQAREAAQAEADAAAAQAAADREAQAAAEAQAQADRDALAAAQREAQEAADAVAVEDAAAKAKAQREADALAAAVAQAEADAQADANEQAQASANAEAEAAAQEAAREARREERRVARREERRREREAAAAAAAAAQDNAAEVVTEEVTEDEVRQSSEEFQTAVTGDAAQQNSGSDDGGLSKFEKALLLGLGAVAVGAVLKNGDKVVSNSGDRVIVEDEAGDLRVLKDDDALIRRPGDQVGTQTFDDGSTLTTVTKPDGSRIVTIRGRDGSVLRRTSIDPQGNEYVLFDDLAEEQEVIVQDLPKLAAVSTAQVGDKDENALRAALAAELRGPQDRSFSLRQIREISEVRALAPELELDAVRFATGSAAIAPEQARSLARIGTTLSDLIQQDPRTVLLVEGHTDAVGDAGYNLALSDRRAETVALALTEYFNVPPENMITQGYGESSLKIRTETAEAANRRAVVRNITGLLQ